MTEELQPLDLTKLRVVEITESLTEIKFTTHGAAAAIKNNLAEYSCSAVCASAFDRFHRERRDAVEDAVTHMANASVTWGLIDSGTSEWMYTQYRAIGIAEANMMRYIKSKTGGPRGTPARGWHFVFDEPFIGHEKEARRRLAEALLAAPDREIVQPLKLRWEAYRLHTHHIQPSMSAKFDSRQDAVGYAVELIEGLTLGEHGGPDGGVTADMKTDRTARVREPGFLANLRVGPYTVGISCALEPEPSGFMPNQLFT